MTDQPKKEAQSEGRTGPESGTALTSATLKGQKDLKARDYLFIDGGKRCIAFKIDDEYYMRPDLSEIEKKQVWAWFFKKGSLKTKTMTVCNEVTDFEYYSDGARDLAVAVSDNSEEINTVISADIAPIAFALCKEAVPLLSRLVGKIHMLDRHSLGMIDECDRAYCTDVKAFFAKLDDELFHGTMAEAMKDVIGEKK